MSTLSGKVALITGGSRGIGFGIAKALLEAGASVAITGTRQDTLDAAARELKSVAGGGSVDAIRADVRKSDEVEQAVNGAASRLGGIDILVNNAGVGLFSPVADMSVDQWHSVIDTNVTGVFYCCRAAIPRLRARGGGWIINISSLAGKNAFVNGAAYCASKAALNQFSEALMQEVRYDGIRVSYIMPGSVNTEFGGPERAGGKGDWAIQIEDIGKLVVDLVTHPSRSLPSRIEMRPAQPPRKG